MDVLPRTRAAVRRHRRGTGPHFAKLLQQAIGGAEGEIRVAMQYLFQAWSLPPEHAQFRNLLMETAVEELGHVELLATAVTENLRGVPDGLQEDAERARKHAAMAASMTGQTPRHLPRPARRPPIDSNAVPFDAGQVVATGNLAADLYANVMAESTGRLLAMRLYELTDDPGMRELLSYLIARDTMHQNQWLEALEALDDLVPVPASFPQEEGNQEYNYAFMSTRREPQPDPEAPWTQGAAPDGNGEFSYLAEQPGDGEVVAPDPDPQTYNDPDEDGR